MFLILELWLSHRVLVRRLSLRSQVKPTWELGCTAEMLKGGVKCKSLKGFGKRSKICVNVKKKKKRKEDM